MKRAIITLLALALCLGLWGCSSPSQYSSGGYVVDTEAREIYDRGETYSYTIEPEDIVVITYPDGSIRRSYSGGSRHYYDRRPPEEGSYADVNVLGDAVRAAGSSDSSRPRVTFKILLPCLALLGFGIFFVAAPEAAFYLRWGWRFEGMEPSKAGLTGERILGAALIIISVGLFLSLMGR